MSPVAFRIPVQEAQEGNQPAETDDLFPEGVWRGVIEEVRVNEIRPGDPAEFILQPGDLSLEFASVASIQIGQIEAQLEDQPDVGNRKFFDRGYYDKGIYLQTDSVRWDRANPDEVEKYWPLQRTRTHLTNLAMAVPNLSENSDGAVGPVEDFHELLLNTSEENGGLHGTEVYFTVRHRGGTFTPEGESEPVTWKKHYIEKYQMAV